MNDSDRIPELESLDDLAALVQRRDRLFVRWSVGPGADLRSTSSKDELTGVPLPGLSANALDVEPWWADRPIRLWVARRLHDYSHLRHEKGEGVRPWVLRGRSLGRGPDNEPLVADVEPIAWIGPAVIQEAEAEVAGRSSRWGTLSRNGGAARSA